MLAGHGLRTHDDRGGRSAAVAAKVRLQATLGDRRCFVNLVHHRVLLLLPLLRVVLRHQRHLVHLAGPVRWEANHLADAGDGGPAGGDRSDGLQRHRHRASLAVAAAGTTFVLERVLGLDVPLDDRAEH